MMSSTNNDNYHFMTDEQYTASISMQDTSTTTNGSIDETIHAEDDAVTNEAMQAVSKERQQTHKENAAKLQSILENIKHSSKVILREMDAYLQETEEVEKTFIRCRANTLKELQRMEKVEPEVIAATQRFTAQSQAFTGVEGAMNFMVDPAGMSSFSPGGVIGESMKTTAVTPNDNYASSRQGSLPGSSVAGSMS